MPDLGEGQIIVSTGYVSVILESWLPPNVPPHLFFCHLFCLPLLLNGAAEPGSALGSVSGWPGPLWVKYEWRHFSRNKGAFFFGPLGNNTYTRSRFRDPVYKVHV